MILNCIVIDDDPEALKQITSHIKRTPTLQLIGAYTSAREAVRDVKNGHVDVIYLAIQMPELSGIEFARLVPESCRLVFTTAYKEYAFDGIKAGAADYLLKPISFEDFQESYKRVRATFDEYQLQDPIERDRCLVAKVENKFVRIDLDDILYIESMNDYVRFHLTQGRKVTTFSNLKRLESRLPRQQFKRIHRSFIANLCRMDSIGHMRIYYGETSIPISDSYKDAVYQFVNSHLA
ncbi:MAG TPA: DNA-binding response regulator [Prevotella sp.]|nr:LytTR family DNA-binding domain-containing protein [Prevotella sp.]HCD65204.1 DNA-binding response regulator [Prevotella sp.]